MTVPPGKFGPAKIGAKAGRIEELRQHVVSHLTALLESQVRSNVFAGSVVELIRNTHREVLDELKAGTAAAESACLGAAIDHAVEICSRLDRSLELLHREHSHQKHRNGNHVRAMIGEFNEALEKFNATLIEKDLLERQRIVLEQIILSHEHVTQWKEFIQEILSDFHKIFPFNFFFIAFAEEHGLSLFLYHLGNHTDAVKAQARQLLLGQMFAELGLPPDAPLDIEEFEIRGESAIKGMDDFRMLTVSVPAHDPDLSGLLGVAHVAATKLSTQEESVIRSILAVMVMVVGSSKVLSRTLAELEYYSMHDPLTGLYNRRHFNSMLEYEISRSERHSHEFSILLLDLDDFKDINDSYGHPIGDTTLCGIAEILQRYLRKGDLATRIGGDEFAVILTETGNEGAGRVAENLGRLLRDTKFAGPDGIIFHITASIGVVTFPKDAQSVTDLLAGVDIALYRAKERGKDTVCGVDELAQRVRASRVTREYAEKLRSALAEGGIVPFFQPIIDCRTGEIFAFETLARLIEPEGQILAAGSFIGTIEKYGLGRDLDRCIIDGALRAKQADIKAGWPDRKLFINLSAQEIEERNILGFAADLCTRLGVPPGCVVFEILERDAISDMSNMRKFLSSLRESGFAFALDDFGSGYNSFHYLRELHFDFVKIDGAFVRNIMNSRIDYALVRNLSRLCQDIGIRTVAEFVENQGILEALIEMNIDYAQGLHISMPTRELRG